jgi:hypothetical protein
VVCSGVMLVFVVAINGASMMSTNSGFGGPSSKPGGGRFDVEPGVPRLQYYLPDRNFRIPAPPTP